MPLHDTLLKDEVGAAIVVQQFANLRKHGNALVGIAPIVEKYSGQLSVWPPLANMNGHAVFDSREAPRLDNAAHHIGAHLGQPIAEHTQTFRREISADRCDE